MIIAYEKKILHQRGIIASDRCRRPTFSGDVRFNRIFEELFEAVSPHFGHVAETEANRAEAQHRLGANRCFS